MKPVLRWPGGKSRLIPYLKTILPRDFGRCISPFCGAAPELFRELVEPERLILADASADLIHMYRTLRDRPDEVVDLALHLNKYNTKSHFYHVRDQYNAGTLDTVERAAASIYLNGLGFNGLWRYNRSGGFNVPYRKTPRKTADQVHLYNAAGLLRRLGGLHCADFSETVKQATPGDLVYMDPPYVPLSKTSSFTGYSTAFGHKEHVAVRNAALAVWRNGCYVLAHNSSSAVARNLYRAFTITDIDVARLIGAKVESRGDVVELIIRNYT